MAQCGSDEAPDSHQDNIFQCINIRDLPKYIIMLVPSRRIAFSLCGLFSLACLAIGCNHAAKPTEEKVPPAPVKWEGSRQLILEEWTELVGTTQPLPRPRCPRHLSGRRPCAFRASHQGDKRSWKGNWSRKAMCWSGWMQPPFSPTWPRPKPRRRCSRRSARWPHSRSSKPRLEVKSLEELQRKQDSQTPVGIARHVGKSEAGAGIRPGIRARPNDRKLEAADKEQAALNLEIQLYTLNSAPQGTPGPTSSGYRSDALRWRSGRGSGRHRGRNRRALLRLARGCPQIAGRSASSHWRVEKNSMPEVDRRPGRQGRVHRRSSRTGDGLVRRQSPLSQPRSEVASKLRGSHPRPDQARQSLLGGARVRTSGRPGSARELSWSRMSRPKKNAEGKDEQTGKARRLRAVIGMRDRLPGSSRNREAGGRPEKKWHGDLEQP
jgi:hypothetical protein